jgi:formate dehydrogenase (coenzyme F420) alpha subunit
MIYLMIGKTILEDGTVASICRQCDMHCGIEVHIEAGKIRKISGLKTHPQNEGRLCPKGPAAVEMVYHPERLQKPLKRMGDGSFKEISLDQAMDEIAAKLIDTKKRYGARAVACWQGEALGFAQQERYARRFIHAFGSPNYFSCDSLCWAGRHIAYSLVQGYWNACPDFEHAGITLFWGTNPPVSHPTFMIPFDKGRKKGSKLIVIDPRRTKISVKADLHLRPLPGTDGALAWYLISYMIKNSLYDKKFVQNYSVGFDDFTAYSERFSFDYVCSQTGLAEGEIEACCKLIGENIPRVVNYVGVSLEHQENGVNNVRAIACFGALCGAIDIKGGDLWPENLEERDLTLYKDYPLTELEPVGADRFPVLYDMIKECHTMTGMDYMLGEGTYPVKALIVSGGNPANTNPNSLKVARALSGLDLLVVRDLFMSETARLAHYVLPAASFLERTEVHVYSHYQMVSLSKKILEIPDVTDEYSFWHELARRLGFENRFFPWENEAALNEWMLEPTGISISYLDRHPEGIQYRPVRYKKYENISFPTPSGKFEFTSEYLERLGLSSLSEYIEPLYKRKKYDEYPLTLISGARKAVYYHSRFRNISRFRKLHPGAEVEINPLDAEKLDLQEGEKVLVTSETGSIVLPVKVLNAEDILPGLVQIAHGWEQGENVNRLTFDTINDPISGFPLLTSIPVRINKHESKR